jgi:methyl-accepting chemotaxis protein
MFLFFNKKFGPTYSEEVFALSRLQVYLPSIIFITAFFQALALCIVVMVLVLLWSHSIAGPLVRFRKHLRGVAAGKLLKETITFRDGDQLQGVAQAFSEMILAHKDASIKSLVLLVEAQKILDECKALRNLENGDSHEFDVKMKELSKIYSHIQEIYTVKKSR